MKISMIGLGKLGGPVAEKMAKHHNVTGYDVKFNIKITGVHVTESKYSAFADKDIIFIAVPTPHDPEYGGEKPTTQLPSKDFDYSALETVLEDCREWMSPDTLIVNISTVLPTTIRPLITKYGLHKNFCYNPYLIAMGTVGWDFLNPDIMVMGFDKWQHGEGWLDTHTGAIKLLNFYKPMWKTQPHITCGTYEEAECIKIFHNTYISAKVGIANMIQDVTQKIGNANPTVIANSLRHADRIVSQKYMEPGNGDGGPCHPRDNIALSWLADKLDLGYDLFKAIMKAREIQAKNIAKELCKHKREIVILGKSFKPDTNLTDGSASMLIGHYCEEMGQTVYYDKSPSPTQDYVYLLAHDIDYSNYYFNDRAIIVDLYRKYKSENYTVIHYGRS